MNPEKSYEKLLENLRQRKQSTSFELAGLAMGGAWIAERLAKRQDLLEIFCTDNVA